MIQCRARSVLRKHVDATSSTPFCNFHGGQYCLNLFTAAREISKSSKEDTVKQITLTVTFQMIMIMVLSKKNEDRGVPDHPISDHLDVWE